MSDSHPPMDADSTVYKTLLESTRAIPWKIDWATMQFSYIGPQIEALLGWSPQSWVTVNDWAERMHPDDRDKVVNFCVTQSQAGVDHEADYRALRKDGSYVWIRDVVHVVRKNGEVQALIGFMFDISERKRNEEELLRLQSELEALSFRDGLTNIANRRMLDQVLAQEWAHAYRQQQSLAIALIDIDFFKQYNDHYGHLAGDDCLKKVAALLRDGVSRPRDFVARYGGEEFMLVLPECDKAAALTVLERCQSLLRDAAIAHAHSAASPWLSISIGLACTIPSDRDALASLLRAADAALYQAKAGGRNRIIAAASSPES